MNIEELFIRKLAASIPTFGPGSRTKGCIAHIKKELAEVEAAGNPRDMEKEWVDVFLLAMDGLLRSVMHRDITSNPKDYDFTAKVALSLIMDKIRVNEAREWPDYRKKLDSEAIEHDR